MTAVVETSLVSSTWFVLVRRTLTRMPPAPGASDTSAHRSAAATWSDSVPRLRSPGEHPRGLLAGGAGLAGELGLEPRRTDHHRGDRGGTPSVVELGEVGGHGRGIELPGMGMRRREVSEALSGGRPGNSF